jgi:putative endopeptidase
MPIRMRPLLNPLFAALLLTLAAGPAAAQRAPAATACTDFYGYTNATWLSQNPLPAGRTNFSRWDQLTALGQTQRDQVLGATTAPAGATVSIRLADLFASAQDEAAIEALGAKPLAPLLAIVNKIRKPRDVAPAIAALHAAGMPVLVDLRVLRNNRGTPYAQVGVGGMGLPDPGFYASADPLVQPVEQRYQAAVSDWLRLTGSPEAQLAAQSAGVVEMERVLAKATLAGTPFQVMEVKAANKLAGALDIEDILKAHGLKATEVAMTGPAFFRAVDELLANRSADQWKVYLRAQIARDMAPTLAKAFHDPWAQLYEVTLAGQAAPTPRAVRARWVLEARVPELLDAAYTQRFLPVQRQQRARAIAEAVKASAVASVERADWLSPAGKATALGRLQGMQIQMGTEVPDNVFDDLVFDRANLAGNVLALRKWLMRYSLVRARSAWPAEQWQPLVALMPQENRLVVTAATLQPPLLDDAGSAADFGGLGALIAQQLSLSLQTFDGADATAWNARAQPLIAQFNAYSATGGATRVNGSRSHAQNQADLAGLEIAWGALNAQGTPDAAASKAFFTGWASLWPRQDKDTVLAAAQATAIHAPAKWRVNGPLANLPAFGQAFSCKAGAMQRPAAQQVALWR